MRLLILTVMILLAPTLLASDSDIPNELRHHMRMEPLDGLKAFPALELDDLPVLNTRQYVEAWTHPLKNINHVSALIADDTGYYIAGTTLHSEDIQVHFDRGAVDDLLGSSFILAASDTELFSTTTGKNIAVSIFHLAADGSIIWVNSFENNLVSASSMVHLQDGRILLAMTPLTMDEEDSFSSFLFFISAEGKVLQRKEYKDQLINSLYATASGDVLAGIVKREQLEGKSVMTFRQYAYFLDTDGEKQREISLAKHPGSQLVYEALSLVEEYDDVFVLSGGDSVFIIDKADEPLKHAFLHPTLDRSADYHINTFYRDAEKNIGLLGFYGREKSRIADMQVNYLQSVTRPTTLGEELTPSYQRMAKNPMLRGIYDEMLSDMRGRIRERGTPFNAVLTSDWQILNLVDQEQQSTQHSYEGSANKNGLMLFERVEDGEQQQYYLLDKHHKLLIRDKAKMPFCHHKCLLSDSTLLHLQWDNTEGYILHQGEFEIVSEEKVDPIQTNHTE